MNVYTMIRVESVKYTRGVRCAWQCVYHGLVSNMRVFNTGGCTVRAIGSDGPSDVAGRGAGAESDSSGHCAARARLSSFVYTRTPAAKSTRVIMITEVKSSTLDWEWERSFPGFGISGYRVCSTENENTHSLDSEYQDVEYARLRTRTLVPYDRSIRQSSTLDWEWKRSLPVTGSIIGSRIRSKAIENAQSHWYLESCGQITRRFGF